MCSTENSTKTIFFNVLAYELHYFLKTYAYSECDANNMFQTC